MPVRSATAIQISGVRTPSMSSVTMLCFTITPSEPDVFARWQAWRTGLSRKPESQNEAGRRSFFLVFWLPAYSGWLFELLAEFRELLLQLVEFAAQGGDFDLKLS